MATQLFLLSSIGASSSFFYSFFSLFSSSAFCYCLIPLLLFVFPYHSFLLLQLLLFFPSIVSILLSPKLIYVRIPSILFFSLTLIIIFSFCYICSFLYLYLPFQYFLLFHLALFFYSNYSFTQNLL